MRPLRGPNFVGFETAEMCLDLYSIVSGNPELARERYSTWFSARESDCAVRRELCFGKKTLKEPIIQTHNFEF